MEDFKTWATQGTLASIQKKKKRKKRRTTDVMRRW